MAEAPKLGSLLEQTLPADLGLRPETDADVPFLEALYAEMRRDELAPVPWPEQRKREFLLAQFHLQRSHYREHYSGAEFLIIESEPDREPIGRLYLYAMLAEIRVMDIVLLEARRGAGLGTAIVNRLVELADVRGDAVTLHVEMNNPALRLYRRFGFETRDERGPYLLLARPAK